MKIADSSDDDEENSSTQKKNIFIVAFKFYKMYVKTQNQTL